eukprot:2507827-Rhodomonas_salina.3
MPAPNCLPPTSLPCVPPTRRASLLSASSIPSSPPPPPRPPVSHLVEQLHERALDLSVSRRALAETTPPNSVDLVHENHAWLHTPAPQCQWPPECHSTRANIPDAQALFSLSSFPSEDYLAREERKGHLVLLGVAEHLSDQPRALPNVLVYDRGRHHLEEGGLDVAGDGTRKQRLPRARRTEEEHSLGRVDSDARKEVRVDQRKLNHLADLPDLIAQATDVRRIDLARAAPRRESDAIARERSEL